MYGYLLQDWTTIRGSTLATNPTGIVQSESDWMSFQPYQDIVFWTDVKSISLGGLTNIALDYETAPAKDDLLFRRMKTASSTFTAPTTSTQLDPIILSQGPSGWNTPLARWVRWKLAFNGTSTSEYGICFRVFCSANAVGIMSS